jgi:hypothetical protein
MNDQLLRGLLALAIPFLMVITLAIITYRAIKKDENKRKRKKHAH